MDQFLIYFILLPFTGLLFSFFANNKKENYIASVTIGSLLLHLAALSGLTVYWLIQKTPVLFQKGPVLYQTRNSEFSIDFYFDRTTAVYALSAGLLTLLVSVFSRYYMHREKGFKRFYNNVLFFYSGLNVVILAGNFETLFIGWEILGITSFFLISFYRDRYLPVKNALKVISLYRVADISLLLGIWLCHHYFEKNITFLDLWNMQESHAQVIRQASFQLIIPAVFLVAVLVKSAQFPFSSWLPRAMEGPSTSSAIFYGSLSVHVGIFLLLRTYPLWEANQVFKAVVILIGLLTSIMCTVTARVQSSVKTQIAYSSIAQIGLMMIEVALGLHWLALIHFCGNAFLRCYQLLVSPSVLSYRIHDQFFNFIPPQHNISNTLLGRIKMSVFVLGIREWNLDRIMQRTLWNPLKRSGILLNFISTKLVFIVFVPLFFTGLFFVYHKESIPADVLRFLPELLSLAGVIIILKAFVERAWAKTSWLLIIINQLFTSLSIGFNDQFDFAQVHIFLSGIIICGLAGLLILRKLRKSGESVTLDQFHGHAYEHPRLAFVFVIACLGLAGFPITPTFIGEDLILGHIHENQLPLTALTALNFVLDGLVVFRIYSRLFLGPHEKGYHEVAYRSS